MLAMKKIVSCGCQEIPPYNNFGSLEDSLQSCLSLIPQPPKKDFIKMLENDHKVLRFEAVMVSQTVCALLLSQLWWVSAAEVVKSVLLRLSSQYCWGQQVSTAQDVKSVLLRLSSQHCWGQQIITAEVVNSALLRSANQYCWGCQFSTAEVVKSVLLRLSSQYCWGCQVSTAEVSKSALLRSASQYCWGCQVSTAEVSKSVLLSLLKWVSRTQRLSESSSDQQGDGAELS